MYKYAFGATIGRFCPVQLGHEVVIRELLAQCGQTLVFVGSANAPWSLPLFFSYPERVEFIRACVPDGRLRLVPLPDFPGDNRAWLRAVNDLLQSCGMPPDETVFYGGSDEDVLVLSEDGNKRVEIVNRYDGTTPVISASQVRDALIHGRPLDGMLNPVIQEPVRQIWDRKWPDFLKKR